ncbi:MAG TPA: prolipoprotein diacylglyceryl transferase family protein [Acidimicrobiales bacterium]|nr:prolipoprotein diacylglyceryl transferase family protein [Acidimicrobiales bacterium]
MKPIPVDFHLGPLQVHTYGIGLALTFWFGYGYFSRRLRDAGYPDGWLAGTFVLVVVAAVVGARIVHVVANFGYYSSNPIEILAVWHGGLSSFGGLGLALPVGFLSAHRRCPSLAGSVAADLLAPVLVAAWALGRLLGPQLMVAGGGKATTAWYGMYYAGEVGRRIPVPLFQALECGAVFVLAIVLERRLAHLGIAPGAGVVWPLVAGLWGLSRFFDEYLWLGPDNGTDAVEIAALCFFAVGGALSLFAFLRQRHRHAAEQTLTESIP